MGISIEILYGNGILKAEWQKKSFEDENSAVQFIRIHQDKIYGINGEFVSKPIGHFDIIDLIRAGGK